MLLKIIRLLIFPIAPLVSVIGLISEGKWELLFIGVVIVVGTLYVYRLLWPLEKYIGTRLDFISLSRLIPIYYLSLTTLSISICWYVINSSYKGNVMVAIFAFTICNWPYSYMIGAEESMGGRVNLIINVVNNYSIVGYLLFGILKNFTNLPTFVDYLALLILGMIFYHDLPRQLRPSFFT